MRLQTTYEVECGLTFHILILPDKEMQTLMIDARDFGLFAKGKISDRLLVLHDIARKVEALNEKKGITDEGN